MEARSPGTNTGGARRRLWFATLGATLLIDACLPSRAARADVALCASAPAPSSDAQALRRAPFAFEGVAVGGREIDGPPPGVELVSPLTFRVTRWIKDGASHGASLPSGAEGVHLWDGRYARLPDGLLRAYSPAVEARFPGEVVVRRGQAWRVYATEENGVNFTCTGLLGSHPLRPPTPAGPSTSPRSSANDAVRWIQALALALLAAVTVALLAWTMRASRRTRQ